VRPVSWPCPTPEGGSAEEFALTFDQGRTARLLIVPALFDEANRMRRFTVEVMRRLDARGIDSFLPDLPGCHDSLQPLSAQTPETWRSAMAAAAHHFRVTHVLGIRGGALLMPAGLPRLAYAPVKGASILRQLIRSRILASREAGLSETIEGLLAHGTQAGLELSGFALGSSFVNEFQSVAPSFSNEISHEKVGGGALWLRAEPDEDPAQADALAAILVGELGG
jgi:hypothetical protein